MENKIINSPTIDDFLLSKKGNESLYFLLKYMKSNAEIRRKRVNGLIINYNNVVNFSNNKLKQEDKNLKNVVKRIFAIEIINQTLMSIEDLAAFCLFFIKFPLEDIPSKIIGYKTKDLENFYLKKMERRRTNKIAIISWPR